MVYEKMPLTSPSILQKIYLLPYLENYCPKQSQRRLKFWHLKLKLHALLNLIFRVLLMGSRSITR